MSAISYGLAPHKVIQTNLTVHFELFIYYHISIISDTKYRNIYILGIKNVYLFALFFASKAKPAYYIFYLLPNILVLQYNESYEIHIWSLI